MRILTSKTLKRANFESRNKFRSYIRTNMRIFDKIMKGIRILTNRYAKYIFLYLNMRIFCLQKHKFLTLFKSVVHLECATIRIRCYSICPIFRSETLSIRRLYSKCYRHVVKYRNRYI